MVTGEIHVTPGGKTFRVSLPGENSALAALKEAGLDPGQLEAGDRTITVDDERVPFADLHACMLEDGFVMGITARAEMA